MNFHRTKFIIITGVSGSGKTTIGRRLAEQIGWRFVDGDDYHPPENVRRMAARTPLTDENRAVWLVRLHEILKGPGPVVLACSALKRRYREILVGDLIGGRIVYLAADYDLIHARLTHRQDHFMGPGLLHSQYADLEVPTQEEAVHVDAGRPVDEIVSALTLLSISQPDDSGFTDKPARKR